jgi:cytochrome P450
MEQIAGELPSYVIAELLGIPLDDGRELYRLTEAIHAAPESQAPGAAGAAVLQMFSYAQGVIREKRARPGEDLATQLLQAEVEVRDSAGRSGSVPGRDDHCHARPRAGGSLVHSR